jgi:hypothetical protein
MPTDTYDDGSPRYDHGHDPVTGEMWWATSDVSIADAKPTLALLMGREEFTSRDGRRFERWSFVTWLRDGDVRQPIEVTGVTGVRGRRRAAWERAISEGGWCHMHVEEHDGRFGVAEVRPVSRLSEQRIFEYAEQADALDLTGEAMHVFADMLPEEPG